MEFKTVETLMYEQLITNLQNDIDRMKEATKVLIDNDEFGILTTSCMTLLDKKEKMKVLNEYLEESRNITSSTETKIIVETMGEYALQLKDYKNMEENRVYTMKNIEVYWNGEQTFCRYKGTPYWHMFNTNGLYFQEAMNEPLHATDNYVFK